ncbi:lebercilin domain-containing protein [Nephila pilipes]|uniref:Lebercilin domain-containing protein n=1 Tax=Nephila pilipes TaxID=299642 RepID=A0A8X6NYT1_NEPPI|nr:lebercilin domain-containing protein [Nephila pilipes]
MDTSPGINYVIDQIEIENAQGRDGSIELTSVQNTDKSNFELKCPVIKKSRDIEKPKNVSAVGNRCTYPRKYCKPPPTKKKPASIRMSNPSAEVVLRERKVEIKDLESQVVYLQNQIKDLKAENKTLLDVQNRQEKELRKFKEGVADIPALLKSHKDEIKAVESSAYSLRRELRECQKELKVKCDIVLRKDQQLDKFHHVLKRNEKSLHELNIKNKELKTDNKKLEDESKKLLIENEEFKSKNERMQKKIQQMTSTVLNLEETVGTAEHNKIQLKEDLSKLQKKYDEALENETNLRKSSEISKLTTSSQTEPLEVVNVSCMTLDTNLPDEISSQQISIGLQVEDPVHQKCDMSDLVERLNSDKISFVDEEENCDSMPSRDYNTAIDAFPFSFSCTKFNSNKTNSRIQKTMFLKPMHSSTSLSKEMNEKQGLSYSEQAVSGQLSTPPRNFLFHSKDSSKKLLKKFNKLENSSFDNCLITENSFQEHLKKKPFNYNSTFYKNHLDSKSHSNLFSIHSVKPNCNVPEWLGS